MEHEPARYTILCQIRKFFMGPRPRPRSAAKVTSVKRAARQLSAARGPQQNAPTSRFAIALMQIILVVGGLVVQTQLTYPPKQRLFGQ